MQVQGMREVRQGKPNLHLMLLLVVGGWSGRSLGELFGEKKRPPELRPGGRESPGSSSEKAALFFLVIDFAA